MKKALVILLAFCMVLSLFACGTSSNDQNDNSSSGSGQSNTSDGSEKRVLKVGVGSAPQNISPFTSFTNRQPVQNYLYETLMERDVNGEWYGIIAKNWTTEDNIVYDIEIYDYVYDNAGNQIKAEDVAFSMIHSRDDAATTWIADCVATGEYTVRLTLTDDQVTTLPSAIGRSPIVSKASYEAAEDGMTTSSVSSAPFIVTDFVPNVSITFEKNPNYWQTNVELQNPLYKNATADVLAYTKIAEAAQQTIALETGTIDVFEQLSTTEVANFLEGGRDAADFTALGYATAASYLLYFGSEGIGADLNFRLACAHAVDKNAVVAGALSGYGKVPTFQGAPEGMSDLTPASASEDYFAYDIELAKQYLAQSSYNGEELVFLVPNEPTHVKIAPIVQAQLLAIGINTKINAYDNALFQADFATAGAFDVAVCMMGMNDVAFVWSFMSANYANFGMGVDDPEFDALLAEVLSVDGHNNEVATRVSDYINEHVYGVNLCSVSQYTVFKKDLGVKDMPLVNMSSRYTGCATYEK